MDVSRRPGRGVLSERPRLAIVVATTGTVLYVMGSALVLWHASSGEPGLFTYWREGLVNAAAYTVLSVLVLVRGDDRGARMGKVFAAMGVCAAVQLFAGQYAAFGQQVAPAWPATAFADDVSTLAQAGVFCLLLRILQIFPDGPLPGAWRLVSGATLVTLALGIVDLFAAAEQPAVFGLPFLGVAVGGSVASILVRWRRSSGLARAQIGWLALGAVAALAVILTDALGAWSWPVGGVLPACAAGVAVLRYRLYDIDRLLSRTASYTLLTGLLALVYTAFVTLANLLLPAGSSIGVALATLAVAGLFRPLRRRVQRSVDRRFHRERYDARQQVEGFAARLRREADLDVMRAELLSVVRQTVQPASVSLVLLRSSQP